MWILFLLATFGSVIAFNTQHQRLALLTITFLATSGFQLMSSRWFASPVVLSKPYDYAYLAILMIFGINFNAFLKILRLERMAALATVYMAFICLVLVASVVVFNYSAVQSFQSARVFFWPLFLLLFLMVEINALEKYVNTLRPIVIALSILYLLQPVTGTNIINPDSYLFNPYLGETNLKRYLVTPDFLIFFLMAFYYEICASKKRNIGGVFGRWLSFALLNAVQLVSFTRSAILGTAMVLIYISKRLLNSIAVSLFLISVLGAVAVAYSSSHLIETRIDESLKDISSSLDGNFVNFRAQKDGNLAFRLAHLNERATYIADDAVRWPIGVGFIHEDSAAAQNLRFKIGLPNPFTGRAFQVDTGDIAWSVVIVKTGFLGLLILLLFLITSFFAVGPTDQKYPVIYRAGLMYFFLTSFFSSNLTVPSYMIPLMLFLALALRSREALTSDRAKTLHGRSSHIRTGD